MGRICLRMKMFFSKQTQATMREEVSSTQNGLLGAANGSGSDIQGIFKEL
jgi:hypothetical protein